MCEFISSGEFDAFKSTHQSFVLLDVREEEECKSRMIPGSVCVPHWLIPFRVTKLVPDKNASTVVYSTDEDCAWVAAVTLESYGYTNVFVIENQTK